MKILDCTLRDGGYYTNWDFSRELVAEYLHAMEQLPIDVIEIGYRNVKADGYFGEYYFLPESTLKFCREHYSKSIAVMLNAKDVVVEDIEALATPCQSYVNLFRLATAPDKIQHSVELAKELKKYGFEVALNIMYLSKWGVQSDKAVFDAIRAIPSGIVDYICMVDSFGSVYPTEVPSVFEKVQSVANVPICFHGHNNLELAFANTLEAMKCGCEMVDCTITGMGRGAGNLKTELLLTYMSKNRNISFYELTPLVEKFEQLQKKYEWGTNIPYMISGVNSLPQKDIMSWMSLRRYSVMQIVQKLIGDKCGGDAKKIVLNNWSVVNQPVLIIGGGASVVVHQDAIRMFMKQNKVLVVFSSAKYLDLFHDCTTNKRVICIVGSEGKRIESKSDAVLLDDVFLANSNAETYYLPKYANRTYYLQTDSVEDSPLFIALSSSRNAMTYLVGFDGYASNSQSTQLSKENQDIFEQFRDRQIISLLPTEYNLPVESIYSKI